MSANGGKLDGPSGMVRVRRVEAGLTQERLAELSGLSVRAISDIERGKTARPRRTSLALLEAVLGKELLARRGPADDPVLAPGRGPGPPSAVPRQLPPAVRGFTGRARELSILTELLDKQEPSGGAVVISALAGTAGVGKTALAVHWAHQVAGRFPDGQLYVNLRGYDPDRPVPSADVLAGFLRALGVPGQDIPAETHESAALYRSLLAGRRMLVVLDNARSAEQVRPLLPGAPNCAVMVTSRDALAGLVARDGAARLDLDLLPLPDAISLLRTLVGGRVDADPGAAEELAERCCRLPLALRVAAELVVARPAVPLAELAAELRDQQGRLDLLDAGGDPRTGMRTVLSWSYRHLGPEAARVFRLLGLHPGPHLGCHAAAALAGITPEHARHLLGVLDRAHLIHGSAPRRYGMHDLLRAYARELSEARDAEKERRAALTRLFDHYLHTSRAVSRLLDPTRDAVGLAAPQPGTLIEPPGDYAQAWAWAEAEHQALLAVVTQATAAGFETYAWQILHALEPFFLRRGLWHEFVAAQHASLDAAVRTGDLTGQAHMHRGLGRGYILLGSFEDAEAHLSRAIAGFRELGHRTDEARAHIQMGIALRSQDRYGNALSEAEQALGLYRASGHLGGQAGALNNIGLYHTYLGNHQEAVTCCRESLARFSELGNRHGAAAALDTLGYAYYRLGRNGEALTCYQQALDAFREHGDRFFQAEALTHLGDAHYAAGNPQAAYRAWRAALSILSELRHSNASLVRTKLGNLDAPAP